MALFSNAKNIKKAKEAAGAMQYSQLQATMAVDDQLKRDTAAEQAKANIFTMLGAPGSYGAGATAPTVGTGETDLFSATAGRTPDEIAALKKTAPYTSHAAKRALIESPIEGMVNPEGYANTMAKSAGFQIQSTLVGEARDLLNRSGPGWERLENATIGTINEGAALQLRDTIRQIKNSYAKGGSARRTALNEANTILAMESANRSRVQETWQANLRLDEYVRQNAERVQEGTGRWLDNLPLISNQYRDAMHQTASLKVQQSAVSAQIAGVSYDIMMSQQARNTGEKLVESLVSAVGSAVASYYGGPAAGAAIGSALSGPPQNTAPTMPGAAPTQTGSNSLFDFSNLKSLFNTGPQGAEAMAQQGYDIKG